MIVICFEKRVRFQVILIDLSSLDNIFLLNDICVFFNIQLEIRNKLKIFNLFFLSKCFLLILSHKNELCIVRFLVAAFKKIELPLGSCVDSHICNIYIVKTNNTLKSNHEILH